MTDLDDRALKVVSDFCGYLAGGRWDPLIDGIANALAEARGDGIEAAIIVLRERVQAYRRVHDYTAADLLETNADCIRDLLLLNQKER